jgi:hypothetical protein
MIDTNDIATTAVSIMTGVLVNNDARKVMREVDGYIEFCGWIAELAEQVEQEHERRYQEAERNDPGVWAYEVAEPLGAAIGEHIVKGGDYGSFPWQELAKQLNDHFYKQ